MQKQFILEVQQAYLSRDNPTSHLDVPGRKWMDQWLGSMGYFTYL